MSFIWPSMLLALLLVPLVGVGYIILQRRRSQAQALSWTTAARGAKNARPGFRRHLPPLLSLISLAIILAALARPQAQVRLPRIEGTVFLVFDVSGSMAAADVQPSRLEAAKNMAREFIRSQPETVKIGIVSFSSSGFTLQMPTNDANLLSAAIGRLEPTRGTSLGQGILAALKAIAVDAGLAPPEATPAGPPATPAPGQEPAGRQRWEDELFAQLPEGPYPPAVIVLLSDGEDNESIDPVRAALAAAERQVRVDALGFGTPAGTVLEVNGYSVFTALNEPMLQAITQAAGGAYYPAGGEQDPHQVFASLRPELVVKPEDMEITSIFAGAGLLILLAGSLFSMMWFNRLV